MSKKNSARPFVAVNFALTFDGKSSTRNLTPSDFSSKRDQRRLLEIRATGDAILVGKGTLENENMAMGLPDAGLRAARVRRRLPPYPLRVVVSNSGRLRTSLQLFKNTFSPILLYSTQKMPAPLRRVLKKHATVHLSDADSVDLAVMLAHLLSFYKVQRLVCEGGPTLLRSLLARDLVDELNVTFCPRLFGGDHAPTLTGLPGDFLPRTIECELAKMEVIGAECFLRYRVLR